MTNAPWISEPTIAEIGNFIRPGGKNENIIILVRRK